MKFEWFINAYYNDTVKHPKQPGILAIQIGGICKEDLYLDTIILEEREDIGLITLTDPNGNTETLQKGPDD